MSNEISKTIVYPNGDTLNIDKVRNLLMEYYKLTVAEKRSFDRLCIRQDLKQKANNQ